MSDALRIASQIVEQALAAGAQEAEAFVQDGRELQVRVAAEHLDFVKEAHKRGAGLRVFVDHRLGFVFSSDFRPQALADLAARAVRLARLGLPDEQAVLPSRDVLAGGSGPDLDLFDAAIPALSAEKRIAMAIAMEKAALGVDPRIQRTQGCGVASYAGTCALASSNGAALAYDATSMHLFVTALAGDAGGRQQGWGENGAWRHLSDADDPETMGRKAGREALRRLAPRKVETQKVPVVMHWEVVASWLENVVGAFSGEEVQKQRSFLADKLGSTIAAPCITLVNDGTRPRGAASEPFDGEGVATRCTPLVEAGVCKAFLYDSAAARKAGVQPTGSAQRGYSSVPSIGPHNLVLEPGDTSLENLIAGVRRGFYYVDSGSFGYNTTTGDYSFQASGFWIENGAIAYPVDGITVASTTLDMLKNVDAVGSEVERRGSIICPPLRISEMTVSG